MRLLLVNVGKCLIGWIVVLGLASCQPVPGMPDNVPALATAEQTGEIRETVESDPGEPTTVMAVMPTAFPPPSPTPVPIVSPHPTALSSPQPAPEIAAGLPCPEQNPEKPEYTPYTLSNRPWPAPETPNGDWDFPLADPLPGAVRNAGYPYGSDGSGRYLLHNGMDMAHDQNHYAVAAADGTVIVARDDVDELFGWRCDWYGRLVIVQLAERGEDEPVYLLYGHVADIQVAEGDFVFRGDPIAREGTAGAATVAHVHFEMRVGENTFESTRNPLLWIEPPPGTGVIAGRLVDPDGRAWQGVTVTLIDRRGIAPFVDTWTYLDDPDHIINPDPRLGENFVFGPIEAGTYDVFVRLQGVDYRQTVEVQNQQMTLVEIVTEPYRPPEP